MTIDYLFINHQQLVLDSVSFDISQLDLSDTSKISIQQHPDAACLVYNNARCLISDEQAEELIRHGIKDIRKLKI